MAEDRNGKIISEFRSNAGLVGGVYEGKPLLLLHTTGARTGAERVNPLMYQRVGDSVAIFASKGGAPDNPDWYHNVVANPQVRVEMGAETFEAAARVAGAEERERIWTTQKEQFPQFAEYETKTSRQIPVVVLESLRSAPAAT